MGLFDFGSYKGSEAVKIADETHSLAVASAADATSLIKVGAIIDATLSSPAISGTERPKGQIPEGWREVDPRTMGFSGKEIGYNDFILVESPVLGKVDGTVQFKVYESNDGRLSISWAATNNPLDVADFFALNNGGAGPLMDGPLSKVAAYAKSKGYEAKDVMITGYSLGGAYTVIMAELQNKLAGGFFDGSIYVSHNGPKVAEGIPNLLNFGSENDVVYRAIGDFPNFKDATDAAGPLLEGSDFNFKSTADNVIFYDGAFNNPLFPFGPFSILNFAGGWYGHGTGLVTDAIYRIGSSSFYDLTNRDSAVVVSTLGADLRGIAWVEDKATRASSDHYGKSAFLIGTNFGDRLRDGAANDFLDGLGGDDLIRVSEGMDWIDGGAGNDTLRLRGDKADWDVYRLSDGTLAFVGKDGLKLARNIERVEFEGLAIGKTSLFNDGYKVHTHELYAEGGWFKRLFRSDIAYDQATEGTNGDDTLSGKVVFGMDGNDTLTGTTGNDLLHGGSGADVIRAGAGDDRLYGGNNNDTLISDGGNDLLNGGHGADTFVFAQTASGKVTVEDFGRAMGETDRLMFDGWANTKEDVLKAATQTNAGVVLDFGALEVTLQDATLSMLTSDTLAFV